MWHSPGVHSWEVTRERRARVEVTLRVGPRGLAGRVTRAELDRIAPVLDAAVEAERRGDHSRIRLGAGLRRRSAGTRCDRRAVWACRERSLRP